MKVSHVAITRVEIPQTAPTAPYRTHIRASSATRSAIVRLDTDDGISGWGEFNINFLPDVDSRTLTETAAAWIIGRDPVNIAAFHRDCRLESRLRSGLEMACWDVRGKSLGVPVSQLLGGVVRECVEVAACIGIQTEERAGELAAEFAEQGFRTLKAKAGRDPDEDVALARGVRNAVGDRLKLRLDANCAYDLPTATALARRLEEFELEYFEQPLAAEALDDACELRAATRTPIALNESVTDEVSVYRILQADAADFLLPDTHLSGGIWPCVKIGHQAEAAGLPCVMHCGHDLGPKTAAMLHVAAACSAYSLANDTTYYALESDILTEPFRIRDGTMRVPTAPGLGISVDPEKLERYALD